MYEDTEIATSTAGPDRRRVLGGCATGVLAALGALGLARSANAAKGSSDENQNIATVGDFIRSFTNPYPDLDRVLSMVADRLVLKSAYSQEFITLEGRDRVTSHFKELFAKRSFEIRFGRLLDTWAVGPVVVHHREASNMEPLPKGAELTPIVTVWAFREGKITQILDYPASRQREF